jgi:hypothetical protein
MKGFVVDVMKRWDDLLEHYDLVNIRSLLGGRVKYGFPPAVKDVDVWLPAKASHLQDKDTIMSIRSDSGVEWSLAAQGVKQNDIQELPCGNMVLLGEWIMDVRLEKQVYASPLSFNREIISNGANKSLISSDSYQVICFQKDGKMWLRRGMFEADMFEVELSDKQIVCSGNVNWVSGHETKTIVLDAATGEVVGGDEDAMVAAGKLVPEDQILKIFEV